MASRWVDSGIDWANLDLFEDRTSIVIDELYRAFKEREALVIQTRSDLPTSTVQAWDINANIRDYEKINEIMTTFGLWLTEADPNTFPANNKTYLGWHDHTFDSVGESRLVNTSYFGIPYFTMAAGGVFELLTGVSLATLRGWSFPNSVRLDADLLTMIYKILINLKEILPYNGSRFQGKPTVTSFGVMESRLADWEGTGVDWTATEADYIADVEANPIDIDIDKFLTLSARATGIVHQNVYWDFSNLRNSSNVVVLPSTTGLYGYKYYQGDDTYYSGFTADIFALDSLVAETLKPYIEAHPFAFDDPGGGTTFKTINSRTVLIIKIDIDTMIQYYT
jgi:hypothetical protein